VGARIEAGLLPRLGAHPEMGCGGALGHWRFGRLNSKANSRFVRLFVAVLALGCNEVPMPPLIELGIAC